MIGYIILVSVVAVSLLAFYWYKKEHKIESKTEKFHREFNEE